MCDGQRARRAGVGIQVDRALRRRIGGLVSAGVLLGALLGALVLGGCAVTPRSGAEPLAPPAVPAAFRGGQGRWTALAPAQAQPNGAWWKAFGDVSLDALVERADSNNTSIEMAAARLAQSRALLRSSDADRKPQLALGASAVRQTTSPAFGTTAAGTVVEVGATASYELDVSGRLAKASGAAALDAQAREALLRSTRLLVQANVAQGYFALRAVDADIGLVRQTVSAARETLLLTERRQRGGDVAELDVVRARAEVAAYEAQALALDRRRAELEHGLATLTGALPGSLSIAPLAWDGAPPTVPPGVPASVLARRPDVAAAQRAMQAALARVGVAETAWFPDVALTASAGQASTDLGDLFKWSARAWGVGALLSLPVFDGGRRVALVQAAVAQWDADAAGYREQVLVAFREVEDQLSALRLLADEADAQARAVEAASRATLLSAARYRSGYVSQLELLEARRSELNSRRLALQVRAAQYASTVGLIRALGGGWDSGRPPAQD
jgi:multidrug efflux system outer membrane protein